MRGARVERENGEETIKMLGIWVFLFVLIIDCFVVIFLDWIYSLSGWILVCLEDNDVIWNNWFYLGQKILLCYQCITGYKCITEILFFGQKNVPKFFLIHLKLFFFFPPAPLFSKVLGPPFPWGLGQLPNLPSGWASPDLNKLALSVEIKKLSSMFFAIALSLGPFGWNLVLITSLLPHSNIGANLTCLYQ